MKLKFTKRLSEIMTRYGVVLREQDTDVMHATTNAVCSCSPIEFAIYECALIARYITLQAWLIDQPKITIRQKKNKEWMLFLFARVGLAPPDISDLTCDPTWDDLQSAKDYGWCCEQLAKSGKYYNLID